MNVGKAYAIVRGRIMGDRGKASQFLKGIPAGKRREMGRQDARAHGYRRKTAYKLGEKLRTRR